MYIRCSFQRKFRNFSCPLHYPIKDEMDGTFNRHWGMKNVYNILIGKSEGQKPLRRSRNICEDNIQIELEEGTLIMWTGFISLSTGFSGGLL
jgi:hypothetical protein